MEDVMERSRLQADRWRWAVVARVRRAAANGRRDACALLAQLSVASVAALLLWTGSRRLLEWGGPAAGLLVAVVWLPALAGSLWWAHAFWSPGAAWRAAEARRLARIAAVRAGAARDDLGLAAPLARVRSAVRALPAPDRHRYHRRALAVVGSAERVLGDVLEAGLVDLDESAGIADGTADPGVATAVREHLERQRLELQSLVEELELRCGVGASARARVAARVEVDRCDLTAPVVALVAGGPS